VGAQGSVGVVDHWTPYRNFTFDNGRANIRASETSQISDIAAYMAKNPSLRLGIDGSTDTTNPHNRDLSDRRVSAVRDALIQAGTPTYKIETGPFGDPQLRRERQVEVLLITAQ
jgi:outer membrane protein OmpA-like peptidoglycan-associated protein